MKKYNEISSSSKPFGSETTGSYLQGYGLMCRAELSSDLAYCAVCFQDQRQINYATNFFEKRRL